VYSGACGTTHFTGICVVDADNPTAQSLITRAGNGPLWSPDGANIAVQVNGGICLIDVTGANRRCLSAPKSNDSLEPSAWSPDGKQLLVTRLHERKVKGSDAPFLYFEVLVFQADGSGFYGLPGSVETL
jgi:hypothetical protein